MADPLAHFQPAVRDWFRASFAGPTRPQALGWPAIARGDSTLILAPTGSGKTLAAFLGCLDRLMFAPPPPRDRRCRVLYVSPLKALAVDVERNLRAPLAGIGERRRRARRCPRPPDDRDPHRRHAARERARFQREPADILITTPESLYLLLTSNAREALRERRDGHRRRDPRARADQARRAPGALARAAGAPRRAAAAAHRPLGDAAAARRGRAVPRRRDCRRQSSSGRRRRRGLGRRQSRSTRSAGPARTDKPPRRPVRRVRRSVARAGYRPVTIVDAGTRRTLELRIEVPVEDMARIGEPIEIPSGPAAQGQVRARSGRRSTRGCSS